ncbi:MAG: RHS repeat-associated core domain-containing protein, partial [Flavobacteriales bacterium]|nr:RHS repeat-associated core domain-containing protein [Flavobacteriales bacterium]
PLYNGNISETIWKTSSDNIHRGYGYEYDKLNRLTNAYFGENYRINNHFDEHLSYDKNGNILTLNRTGNVDGFEQVIDDLTYDYIGNQLLKVTEALIANAHFGFKDGTNTNEDYRYDDFGNMVRDLNKGINEINYNHLNLPIKITFANGNFITYIYDAIGVKVNKYVQGTSGSTSTGSYTDYLNGFQYNNNALQFFPHSEGYVKVLGNTSNPEEEVLFDYVYQYKDHLGNIRLNFTKDGESLKILEENHYYPFGLKHTYNYSKFEPILEEDEHSGLRSRRITQVPNSGYQYKYNGKEWQDELNLNLYDYHARNYDPAIGRWMNIDPLAENSRRWNPYTYCYNNPIVFVDPDGMQAWIPDEEGNLIAEKGDNVATLAKHLDRDVEDVAKNFKKGSESIGKDYKFDKGDKVILHNNMTDSIKNSNQTEGYNVETDCYNCHGAAMSAVKGEAINPVTAGFKDLADPFSSEVKDLKSKLREVPSASEAIFGKTILSFGDHSAVFYGTDNNGTEYYYSKNGATEKPGIFTLEQLKSIYPSNPNPKLFNYEP